MTNQEKFNELIALNDKVQKTIAVPDISWDEKFDLVFSPFISKKIFETLDELHISFDYYDPDTTYEEDVMAFANALNEKIKNLQKTSFIFE